MIYNSKKVTPVFQFIEITDSLLKHYWPKGVIRVILKYNHTGTKGNHDITFWKSEKATGSGQNEKT